MSISKEAILAKKSSYDILNHYLRPYHTGGNLAQGKNISNPFLAEKQTTPSFNIFCTLPQHEWRYKDFATADDGSCFDLVMKLFHLSFPDALLRINQDLGLYLEDDYNTMQIVNEIPPVKSAPLYSVTQKPFSVAELAFWQKYNISSHILNRYDVVALSEYSSATKDNKPYTVKSSTDNFIFAYHNSTWLKIYKPLGDKKYKFQFLGLKEQGFIFGWKQLPPNGEKVFITGGEKDVMTLVAYGFHAISLNSETASMDKDIVEDLKGRFKQIIVLYDNDDTGVKQAQLLADRHGFFKLSLPSMSNAGKDISDFFALGGSLHTFQQLLSDSLLAPPIMDLNSERVVYNAVELMAMGNLEPQYLMAPIFPQKGTAVLAGKPDTGKSQFARQLCIQVALGLKSFIDFELNPVHNSAIYVATEDNLENTKYLMNKQMTGLNEVPKENLRFIFADTMEQHEILSKLDEELTLAPADIVVVDSFGDIFKGGDSNNNMAMRNTVKLFDKIAKTHHCLVLFVHHINKGAYRQSPGQEHIQGGAGLMQKVRLGIQLSEGEEGIRYFTVVKGNYCPKEFKQDSIILNFSEDTFLFTNTGNLIPTSDIGSKPNDDKKQVKNNDLAKIAEVIFGSQLVSYTSFVNQFQIITGRKEASAKRAHTKLKELNIIVEANGSYRLANPPKGIDSQPPF